jgi:hypothetical protein
MLGESGMMLKWFNVGLRFFVAVLLFALILLIHLLGVIFAAADFKGVVYFFRQLRSWVREPLLKYRPA